MTEPKFTPGPWVVSAYVDSVWSKDAGQAADCICHINDRNPRFSANAALIAAAPELYAAVPPPERLEALADWFDKYDDERGSSADREVQRDLRLWASLGRAALAKARGER